jgi:hypothetical protein
VENCQNGEYDRVVNLLVVVLVAISALNSYNEPPAQGIMPLMLDLHRGVPLHRS